MKRRKIAPTGVTSYLVDFYSFAGKKAFLSLSILIFHGLTEGASIVMLIPLMGMAGLGGQGEAASGIAGCVVRLFQRAGVSVTLVSVLMIYVGMVSAYSLLGYAQSVLNDRLNQGYARHVRNRLYAALARADWLFISRTKASDITHILTAEVQRIGGGTFFFLSLISSTAVVIVHIVVAFMISVRMTSLILFCTSVLILLMRPMNRHALRTGKEIHFFGKGMFGAISEHLGGMKTAKSFGAEAQYVSRFQKMTEETEMTLHRFACLRSLTSALYNIGTVFAISILFYYAVGIARVPVTNLFILVFLFARILPRTSQIHQMYQNMVNAMPAFSAAETLLHRCEEAAEASQGDETVPIVLKEKVMFEDVSFRYEDTRNSPVLRRISLTILVGQMTAIVGVSGSGKTTLADLIMGLISPTLGQVLIDGASLRGGLVHRWRNSIGYVPQETFLFHDTIRANLAWVRPETSERELWQALNLAAASGFVKNMPHGLDTIVGDRGVQLSGGERQRIALARAILRRPALLLLDEATSSLDTENERQIQQAIESLYGETTIVVISHRLSTIRRADRIIVLKDGQIAETGSWEDLARIPGGCFQAMLKADERDVPEDSPALRQLI